MYRRRCPRPRWVPRGRELRRPRSVSCPIAERNRRGVSGCSTKLDGCRRCPGCSGATTRLGSDGRSPKVGEKSFAPRRQLHVERLERDVNEAVVADQTRQVNHTLFPEQLPRACKRRGRHFFFAYHLTTDGVCMVSVVRLDSFASPNEQAANATTDTPPRTRTRLPRSMTNLLSC